MEARTAPLGPASRGHLDYDEGLRTLRLSPSHLESSLSSVGTGQGLNFSPAPKV
eukprot:CAMPEP_0181479542 /NCGR_PEP_ID=MMETSP1110-20121109/43336_1 /TAXON_ID=174948 /ORGANISM="Symbiodinium sp., Strain CCMP421" /LENGTH=53 /DNA_ID=CAMNT_0023604979 /DNA_START=40 /DNA_END=198 /DNA_ORIENTATION=+